MIFGIAIINGIVLGFEFSLARKSLQLHLGVLSFIALWGVFAEESESNVGNHVE